MPRSTALVLFVVALALAPASADEPLPREGELTLAAERAVVFKDGYALLVKQATGAAGPDGAVFTEQVPDAAVLGTFWALPAPGGPRLASVDAGLVRSTHVTTATVPAARISDVLAWNVEEVAHLELDDGSVVDGTVRQVLAPGGAEVVVIQASTGSVLVPLARVRRLDMQAMRLEREQVSTSTVERKRLTLRFEGGAGERALHLLYFRPGLRWIPTYRVELPSDESIPEVRLALQAEVLNEAEDLVDVPLDLVVGVPHFRFGEVVSPLVLEPFLRNALQEAAPQLMGQMAMASNTAFRSRAGERQGRGVDDGPGAGTLDLPPELTAGGVQDLFVYSLAPTTILRGHRAAVPVFEATAPLGHVYTWRVAVPRRGLSSAEPSERDASPLVLSDQRIWHELELTNGTSVPWTTGAAFVMRGGMPLGQDLLTYTPKGAAVRLPLTVAVDVRGEYEEEETGRALDALRWSGHPYARVDRKGRLSVTNHKTSPIDVEVSLRVGGTAHETSEGGTVVVQGFRAEDWSDYRGDPAVNSSSQVGFRFRLAPGERREAWVSFHYFVPQ